MREFKSDKTMGEDEVAAVVAGYGKSATRTKGAEFAGCSKGDGRACAKPVPAEAKLSVKCGPKPRRRADGCCDPGFFEKAPEEPQFKSIDPKYFAAAPDGKKEQTASESGGTAASEKDDTEMSRTDQEYAAAMNRCRDVFVKKLYDYGTAWRIMRPQSLTDQIYIKAARMRFLEEADEAAVDEGMLSEFMGVVNYGIIGLIQLELGSSADGDDLDAERAVALYDKYAQKAYELMNAKNHDYNEAWRFMRLCSYTDFILMKVYRTKQIEAHHGKTLLSEGVDANYLDMVNYAIFGIVKLTEDGE